MFQNRDCGMYNSFRSNAISKNEDQFKHGFIKRKKGLHVCQKSSMICKRPCRHVRVSQQGDESSKCIQNSYDDSSNVEVASQVFETYEAIAQQPILEKDDSQLQKELPVFVNSATVGRMESSHICASNLETIFSPFLEPIQIHSEQNIDNDAGSNDGPEVPALGADDSDDNKSSFGSQTCNLSDFFISDMIIMSIPFGGNAVDDNISEANSFPDFKCSEPKTLVHSTLEYCDDADFTFTVFYNMKEHNVYVKQRPHLQKFLKKVAEMFEVVIFTASQSIYAEQLLDILDPDRKLISRRFYRESCIFSDGSYTKDLTVLGVDLARVAIIDNSPQVFRLQVNNGIPIKSWFDDTSDCALISLLPFLQTLVDADDVRPIIAKKFGCTRLCARI